jgi:holo-[acyl-carrier protein] synthase
MTTILRSGIDLIEIERIEKLKPEIKARFLQRVYTSAELDFCGDRDERLAGRFACKEAVSKALGTGIGTVHWQEIEILTNDQQMPILHLHGNAATLAKSLGLSIWSVSISHAKTYAMAIAIASD